MGEQNLEATGQETGDQLRANLEIGMTVRGPGLAGTESSK